MEIKKKIGYVVLGTLIAGNLYVSKCIIDDTKNDRIHYPKMKPYVTNANLERKITNTKDIEFNLDSLKRNQEKVLLARMLLGEAGDCNYKEKLAIAYTVINRKKIWYNDKKSLSEVLLEPWQYSCFWEKSKYNKINQKRIMNPEKYDASEWKECLNAANDALTNKYPKLNKKQCFYHAKNMKKPRSWKKINKKISLGKTRTRHIFYRI